MGIVDFLNCKIEIAKKVFMPRIETEFWVEEAIEEINNNSKFKNKNLKILDVFAGTGCIGIAVLKNIKNSFVDFVDISTEAIEQIKTNLKLNQISRNRYKIYKSDLFEKLKGKKYDIIFANPPYVALNRIKEIDKEVLEKEPKEALFAGGDGMTWIKKFLFETKNYLKKNGKIFMEFDPLQKEKIKKILEKAKLKFSFRKDQFKKFRWLKGSI